MVQKAHSRSQEDHSRYAAGPRVTCLLLCLSAEVLLQVYRSVVLFARKHKQSYSSYQIFRYCNLLFSEYSKFYGNFDSATHQDPVLELKGSTMKRNESECSINVLVTKRSVKRSKIISLAAFYCTFLLLTAY